ncbi:MAG: cytochrome P450 [Deltaproteobacteria bacterium]|nr:cytochrome P450 [Deltaproteobacteria bacterium]
MSRAPQRPDPPALAGPELFDPEAYARDGYPLATWARLRREDPVHWYEGLPELPFWALTRRAEIVEVARDPARFSSEKRFHIVAGGDYGDDPRETRTIVQMDPPKHRDRRGLLSARFTPRALRGLEADVEAITDRMFGALAANGATGECDFVEAVAAPLALAVIAHLIDLPANDGPRLFRWTNEMAGATDPQYRQAGESPTETRLRATAEVFAYFSEIVARRRREPGEDLVSILAQARPDGVPLPDHELLSYCLLLIGGGNETTRNAMSGGLLALLEHPEQWRRLRAEPGLAASAGEECLRWTTPVIHNARTAVADCELGGRTIRAGETVALFWPSANRDEAVFDAPDQFRIDRSPNPHLAFGIGEHICLGAHLARMEIRSALRALATRLAFVEQTGPVERLQSSSVGGVKRLPIRYRLA